MTSLILPNSENFSNWFSVTSIPNHLAWKFMDKDYRLDALIDLVEMEFELAWQNTDRLNLIAAAITKDSFRLLHSLQDIERKCAIAFFHMFICTRMLGHATACGRGSLAFNWTLSGMSLGEYVEVAGAEEIVFEHRTDCWKNFLESSNPVIIRQAQWLLLSWMRDTAYAAWKFGNLFEATKAIALNFRSVILICPHKHIDLTNAEIAVEAASQIATLQQQNRDEKAEDVVEFLVEVAGNTSLPRSLRKLASVSLSTRIGQNSTLGSEGWAQYTINRFSDILTGHERIQIILSANSSHTDAEHVKSVLCEVENLVEHFDSTDPQSYYKQIELYAILLPFIRDLLLHGKVAECVELIAAWFGVPTQLRRQSASLVLLPSCIEGILFSESGRATLKPRDTENAWRRFTHASNAAFDQNVVILGDPQFEPRGSTGRRESDSALLAELRETAESYLDLDAFFDFWDSCNSSPSALVLPHGGHLPIQSLLIKNRKKCLPIVVSFEQPKKDRKILHAAICCCGTFTGAEEAKVVNDTLTVKGIDCTLHLNCDIQQLLQCYHDPKFDLVWIIGHGEFDSCEPSEASIRIENGITDKVSLSHLLRRERSNERRLLVLNICHGGAVHGTQSPPKLGLASLLARADQAVISHLWEVPGFSAATVFGIATASAIAQGDSFFKAFIYANEVMQMERLEIVKLLQGVLPQSDDTIAFIQRLSTGTWDLDVDDLRSWGTPVFYE